MGVRSWHILMACKIVQVTDSTFTGGSPGLGFFLQGATGLNANHGFSNFTATDGMVSGPTRTPLPLAHNPLPGISGLYTEVGLVHRVRRTAKPGLPDYGACIAKLLEVFDRAD